MKLPQKISLKTAIITVLLSVLLTTGIVYVLASPNGTFTISPYIYPGAPKYTIFKEGNTYYAKNAYGAIDYSGTNATMVIQSALDSLTSGRTWKEQIVLKGDLGDVYNVVISSYTSIKGIGAKVTLPPDKTFVFKGSSDSIIEKVDISGIEFKATTTGRSVEPIFIDLSVGGATIVKNIEIYNSVFSDAHYTSGTPSAIRGRYTFLKVWGNNFDNINFAIYLSKGHDIKIFSNRFESVYAGSQIYCYFSDSTGVGTEIYANYFYSSDNSIMIEGIDLEGGKNVKIYGNTFYNLGIDGILIGGNAQAGSPIDIIISNNNFESIGLVHPGGRGGISIGPDIACYRILIIGNDFLNNRMNIRIGEYGKNLANNVEIIGNNIYG